MQEFSKQNNKQVKVSFQEFSPDEKQKLVGAFVWLIEQDKKQNPALYQRNKKQDDWYGMPLNS